MGSHRVFVAVPTRGYLHVGTALSLLRMGQASFVAANPSSLLALNFNELWCQALNRRSEFTHFVMLHDDVEPKNVGWVDLLVKELERSKADVLSCVVPIKDERGLTSTAFMNTETKKMTRLTLKQAMTLPVSFDGPEAGFPGHAVLPNTGCWICRLPSIYLSDPDPWQERVRFTIVDRIVKDANGQFAPRCYGEDWKFGVDCWKMGVTVKATRILDIMHHGTFAYPNFVGWGGWESDKDAGEIFWGE